ncbi:MAG: hypothetical protein C4539_14935 [Ignavibacteriales bacterium]|nr:MAG: hypothetical protein C4539_14935 [Ignavibacteriales bacterium]
MSQNQYGNFRIIQEIGKGGMGMVYKGYDSVLDREVAIKFLNIQSKDFMDTIKKFKQEARNQAKLSHPNIVPIYDFIQESGTLGIVMEYVEGETLENLIVRKSRLDLQEAIEIIKQVINGLDYAHSKGFLHLDVKPSNIIISKDGVVKIMDFGISKSLFVKNINIARTNPGTLPYMSPELFKSGDPTIQSDIYSLGITFYEMLAGVTPFEANSADEIINGHLHYQPSSILHYAPELPEQIDKIILTLLAKNPNERLKNLKDFYELVNLLGDDKNANSINQHLGARNNKRYKIKAIIYSALILIFAVGSIYYIMDQVLANWKSGKDLLLLNENEDKGGNKTEQKKSSLVIKALKSPVYENLNSINQFNNNIFCCGEYGVILKSSDNGSNWLILNTNITQDIFDVIFINEKKGFAIGDSSVLLQTTDGGYTWEKQIFETDNAFLRIKFVNQSEGFIVGNKGLILKTNDAGLNWLRIKSNSLSTFYDIFFLNDKTGFIVGKNGDLLKTTDKGETWIYQNQLTSSYLKSINFVNNRLGFIVGGDGNILRTENSGETWSKSEENFPNGLFDVTFKDIQHGIVIGSKGLILYTTNSGKNWKLHEPKLKKSLNRIILTNDKSWMGVGVNGAIMKLSFN